MSKRQAGKHPGVRWRKHQTRKHGVRADRYFTIRLFVDGKSNEEGLGWESQGWTEVKAATLRAELVENQRRGEGPRTLTEKRALETANRQKKAQQAEREIKDRITFKELAEDDYITHSKATKNNSASWKREEQLFKLWINPVIGKMTLKDVAPIHLEKIKSNMAKMKRSPRSIHYCLSVIRQVFNYAIRHDLFEGVNPVSKVKLPSGDNRCLRFLTREEAGLLLAALATKSPDVHDMALISLHTGMRAGEVFGLTWGDVDVNRGILILRDTKNTRTRAAFMTEAVKGIFRVRKHGAPAELVFCTRQEKKIKQISLTFARAVDALKFNEGVKDRRHKVTFHTLRHTYASWHVEAGTDLYVVKELLGHSDFRMTSRYSHLGENTLHAAVKRLDNSLRTLGKVNEPHLLECKDGDRE